jgi:leucyl-tRNA synthetase
MDMARYSQHIDAKWQKRWEDTGLYRFDRSRVDKKLYCLEMCSYPSGAKLHIGHWWNFGLTDSWARAKRMQGYEVFEPMGFDAFGLPAENYAIKTGIHPKDSTESNIESMRVQLRTMGAMFDWDYEVVTCDPDYYRWTQWLFLQLYKHGLAYRKEAPVNWCPSCNTSLANEQVDGGSCERCSTEVTKKDLTQWFFRITAYADELIEQLDTVNWPEKTKTMQRNWIGRSSGALIRFALENHAKNIEVFTTRADTLLGCSYMVLAPENSLVDEITAAEYRGTVEEYREAVKKLSEIDRLSTVKEKTGVFTGAYAVHPISGERLPIWIADYVLATYGTGAVMAVPGHDTRDFDFATKYALPIPKVIAAAESGVDDSLPFIEYGLLVNSGPFDGLTSEQAKTAIIQQLGDAGEETTNYRLRDWLVSRQRYWGAPIPIVYCDSCGAVPVPEEDLPVLLPYNVDFTPDGRSPLAKSADFIHTPCPSCGQPGHRDTDTLDTFVCSSWYFLRYADSRNSQEPWDVSWVNRMLPVDMYVGGPEHACMHLLYARFVTKALRDMGYLHFDEPFLRLVHQGIILGDDGEKMSKSKGNVISPDPYIEKHGSDAFRLYLAFGFNYIDGGPWSDDGIRAVVRFMDRVERFVENLKGGEYGSTRYEQSEKELNFVLHNTIKGVTRDIEEFGFNTCVSRLMELMNALYKYDQEVGDKNTELMREVTAAFTKMLAPFAPHFAEELWESMGHEHSIHNQPWPEFNENLLVLDTVEMVVQVNGRIRDKIQVASDASEEQVKEVALRADKALPFLYDKTIRKVIVVKGSLVNIVVS